MLRDCFLVLLLGCVAGCGTVVTDSVLGDKPSRDCKTGVSWEKPEPPAGYTETLPDPYTNAQFLMWYRIQTDEGAWCVVKGWVEVDGEVTINNSTDVPVVQGIPGRIFVMFKTYVTSLGLGLNLHPNIATAFRFRFAYPEDPNPWNEGIFWKPYFGEPWITVTYDPPREKQE